MGYRRGDFSSLLVRSSLPPSHSETPDTQAITREAKKVTYNQGLIQLPFKKRPMFTHAALLALYYRKIIWRSWKFLPSVCVEWRFGHAWKKKRTLCPIKPPSEFDMHVWEQRDQVTVLYNRRFGFTKFDFNTPGKIQTQCQYCCWTSGGWWRRRHRSQ